MVTSGYNWHFCHSLCVTNKRVLFCSVVVRCAYLWMFNEMLCRLEPKRNIYTNIYDEWMMFKRLHEHGFYGWLKKICDSPRLISEWSVEVLLLFSVSERNACAHFGNTNVCWDVLGFDGHQRCIRTHSADVNHQWSIQWQPFQFVDSCAHKQQQKTVNKTGRKRKISKCMMSFSLVIVTHTHT